MRLWSIHPKYLDSKGLVAVWREGLLALAVLQGKTNGYKNHPQLDRFRATENPVGFLASYLESVAVEAYGRGYEFDMHKIPKEADKISVFDHILVTEGQLIFESDCLYHKLLLRKKVKLDHRAVMLLAIAGDHPTPHPLFKSVPGSIEPWEKT